MEGQKKAQLVPGNIETTLGDLIAAVAEIALEAGENEQEGYELASKALYGILRLNKTELSDSITS